MTDPFFSVIVPAYNQSRYLAETLQSVIEQTSTSWELLVVDDGSRSDEAKSIARVVEDAKHRAPRAAISFCRQENQGVSVTRNRAATQARAPWLAFLDNDDLWRPTTLEEVHRVLEKKPNVALCHTNFVYIDGQGEVIGPGFGRAISYLEALEGNFPIFPCCSFVSKGVFEQMGGFDPLYPLAQDLDFYLKIYSRDWPVEFLDVSLALYRAHGQNESSNYRGTHREIAHILQKHLIHGLNYANYDVARAARKGLNRIRQTYGERSTTAAIRCWQTKQLTGALTHALYAARVHPPSLFKSLGERVQRKLANKLPK